MNTIRPLSLMVLILLLIYVIADHTGMVEQVDNMVHQKEGWTKIDNGYYTTEIEKMHIFRVALLKDPESNSFNIYKGAMKKSAVDRMELVSVISIELSDKDQYKLATQITDEAKSFKCNTAIINGKIILYRTKSQSFGAFSRLN